MRHVAQRLMSLPDLVSSENSNLTVCLWETRGSCLRYLIEQKVTSCRVNTRNLVFIEMVIFSFAVYGDVIDTFFPCGIYILSLYFVLKPNSLAWFLLELVFEAPVCSFEDCALDGQFYEWRRGWFLVKLIFQRVFSENTSIEYTYTLTESERKETAGGAR